MQVKKKKSEMKLPKVFPREQPLPALWQLNFVHIGLRSHDFHPVSRRITWEEVCGHVFGHRRGPGSRALRPVRRRGCSRHFGCLWPQGRGGGKSLGWGGLGSGGVRKHQGQHGQQVQLRSAHRAAGPQRGATGPWISRRVLAAPGGGVASTSSASICALAQAVVD